jgi:methyl-accepting chemotaxis protein
MSHDEAVADAAMGALKMTWLNNFRINIKFIVLIGTVMLGLAVAGLSASRLARQALLNDRVHALKSVVEIAATTADSLDKQVQAGKLTREQGLDALRERLAAMKYDNGDGYIYAYTLEGIVVYLPDPKLIGADRIDYKLASGRLLVRELIDGAKKDGATVTAYGYPKPGQTAESDKLAYTVLYKPWNLIFGSGVYLDDMEAELSGFAWSMLVLFVGLGLIVALLASFIALNIARPLVYLQGQMRRLADGDLEIAPGDTVRRDELGEMARTMEVFKTNAIEVERLRSEQLMAETRAAEQRKVDTNRLADDFESAVGEIVETVSSASTELEASATSLMATATRSEKQATIVAAASGEASTNVESVAAATEELTSSVNEISRQVQESARIANDAVDQARKTNDRVDELTKAAGAIGAVVELINNIASQTNLLALNATIEAARAGEAGRGFAVVASEVKALAEQTAKATGEIGQHIVGIQAATQDSVSAIKEIGNTIGRMSEIASTIAAAVEEQGAATQEISRNVQQAANGTTRVSANIAEVQRGASETGSASSQVLSAAQSLSHEGSRLKLEVGKFLDTVRAA